MEEKAELLARTFHSGQKLRCSEPQLDHIEGVVKLLKDIGIDDDEVLAAAWLHDSFEDTDLDSQTLITHTSEQVAEYVHLLTRNTDRDKYLERIGNAPREVQIIKLADVIHNCTMLDRGLRKGTIQRRVHDCKKLYFALARKLHPEWYLMMKKYLDNGTR
ncbi:MAG: HD domain-containing protein [Nanobdellota archaeon]